MSCSRWRPFTRKPHSLWRANATSKHESKSGFDLFDHCRPPCKRWSTVVTSSLLEGEVVPSFLAHTAETKPDLVVMTTHGRGPLGRFWLGSVADELARVLPVPLLLVRPQAEAEPDLETEPPLRQILIPLDGSKLAEQILGPRSNSAA